MTVEDIYKRLAAGESDKDIAQELVDMLNQAVELKSKRDKETEERAAIEAERKDAAQHIADSVNTYLEKYYNYKGDPLTTKEFDEAANLLSKSKVEIIDKPNKKGVKISGDFTAEMDKLIDELFGAFGLK